MAWERLLRSFMLVAPAGQTWQIRRQSMSQQWDWQGPLPLPPPTPMPVAG